MKQIVVYFGLFIGFASVISATRYVDNYSLAYEKCVKQWHGKIKMAEGKPYLSRHLIDSLDTKTLLNDDKTCPKLLDHHARYLRTALEKNL